MTQENDNEIPLDNVIDFTAYKLRNMVEELAHMGQSDLADALQEALDTYMLGHIDIVWRHGWPYMIDNEDIGA